MESKIRQGTRAVWAGEEDYLLGATQVPVVLSAAFGYSDMDEWLDVATGKAEGHIYTRNSNPTIAVFEEKARLLEDAEAATSAASGMGVISSTLFCPCCRESWSSGNDRGSTGGQQSCGMHAGGTLQAGNPRGLDPLFNRD